MQLYLLTHEREFNRRSNSGRLVQAFLADKCRTIAWRRTEPDNELLAAIKSGRVALLAPKDKKLAPADSNEIPADNVKTVFDFDGFILLDGTWQEATKMFNKSPYLQTLPRYSLSSAETSEFILRANQVEGGLSTAECAIALLRESGQELQALELHTQFKQFIKDCL